MSTLAPRFPGVAAKAGHYESIYLVANHPTEPVAVWIRYTVHKRPGEAPTGSIWFTLFQPTGPTAVKVTTSEVTTGAGSLMAVRPFGQVGADGADGEVSGRGVAASWDLRFAPDDDELRHMPYDWMYRAAVPRTKSTSPYPSMRVAGTATVGGATLTVDGWRGMLGHNWGAEHAHRWIWLRGACFVQRPDAWLDVVLGRIKLGPFVAPWIGNGVFAPDGPGGVRYRVGGLGRRVSVEERTDGCDLVLPGEEASLTVQVSAPLTTSVGWEYADPTGGRHQVRNCSTAGLRVEVTGPRVDGMQLVTAHGGAYELGATAFDYAVDLQPYPDG